MAGKSRGCARVQTRARDHPRVGGEKGLRFPAFSAREGSPPRGRGKDPHATMRPERLRITPAWAGKSAERAPAPAGAGDHPRVGGEKQENQNGLKKWAGSPPRGRGKALAGLSQLSQTRITPAWAGKSGRKRMSALQQGDHPRMGGEKNKELEGVWLPMGSPPRRRGKVVHCAAVRALRGITPRVGGEKPFLFCGGSSDSGSPPRGRGKEGFCLSQFVVRRITPA